MSDPVVMISYSDDDGHTWSAEQIHTLGAEGDYLNRVKLFQQGSAQQRIYRVRFSDPYGFTLVEAFADIEFTDAYR